MQKNILITGASSGIGASCAEVLAKRGHGLVLVARRGDRLREMKQKLASHQIPLQVFELDVRDRKAVEAFAADHSALLATVDVLINNAGLAKGLDPIQSGNPDHWEAMIDTNVKGLLYLSRAVLPHLIKRGQGDVINVGSVAGRWAYPKGNAYCASKAAVRMLNECMRLDLSGTGIRVTEIAPGMAETEFSLVRLDDAQKAKAVYQGVQALTADDIADAVAWCLDRPRHVTVQELVIYPTAQASPWLTHRQTP